MAHTGRQMIELKTPAEIEEMRAAGSFVADVLTQLRASSKVGTNLLKLDSLAHGLIRKHGATSCYIDYHPSFGAMPFGKVIVAIANKHARQIWAMLAHDVDYDPCACLNHPMHRQTHGEYAAHTA